MTKLTVVYLSDTGHVLAALTRADPPTGTEQVSALVGTGLPVRFIGNLRADAIVAAQCLAVATFDDQPGVVTSPQSFIVDSKSPAQVQNAGASSQVTLAISHVSGATVTGASAPGRPGWGCRRSRRQAWRPSL